MTNDEIVITATGLRGGNVQVTIPATTSFSSSTFDGILILPTDTDTDTDSDTGCNSAAVTSGAQASCIEIGQSDSVINSDKPIRIQLGDQAGNVPWYSEGGAAATQITTACTADDFASVSTQLEGTGECFINTDSDLIIWTTHFTVFGSNLVSPPPPPVVVESAPEPESILEPTPRRSGGGGGGGGSGGGGSGGGTDRGSPYDLSFIFTSDGANALTGPSQITLESDTSLTIAPRILPIDIRQNILKMEIIILDHTTPELPAAALIQYMLIPNILTHDKCTGKEYTLDRLYVCDFSSIISETQVTYLESALSTAKRFDNVVIPFEEDFSGNISIFMQDNRGITLSSHTDTMYGITVTSGEDDTPEPVDGMDSAPMNPEPAPMDPEPAPMDPEPAPMDPKPVEMNPESTPQNPKPVEMDPESIRKDPESAGDRNVFEKIVDWFQSLFGFLE